MGKRLARIAVSTLALTLSLGGLAYAQDREERTRERVQRQMERGAKQTPQATEQEAAGQEALVQLHAVNQLETDLALSGINMAQSQKVRDFANMLAKDHQESDRKLMEKARSLGIDVTVSDQADQAQQRLDKQTQQYRERLKQASGEEFDRAFMDAVVQTHRSAIQQLRGLSEGIPQDTEASRFVQQRVEKISDHLSEAQRIQQDLRQAGPGQQQEQEPPR